MGKRRKTLREKKLTELRQTHTISKENTSGRISQESTQPITPTATYTFQTVTHVPAAKTYALSHDLQKTLLVSAMVILLQFILYFLLKTNALVLPLVSLRY